VVGRGVDLELVEHVPAEGVLRQHALDGLLDREGGLALEQVAVALALEPAGDARVVVVVLLVELVARQLDLRRVDDDDEVAGVDVGRVLGLVLAREHARDAAREAAEGLALGVDHEPLAGGDRLGRLGLIRTLVHRNVAFPRRPGAIRSKGVRRTSGGEGLAEGLSRRQRPTEGVAYLGPIFDPRRGPSPPRAP
jgi:hypothetical protein